MSSVVRPNLKSRSSLMSLSQRRMLRFAGSSFARTSLRTRPDRAFRHPAGRFEMLCRRPSMAMIPSFLETGSCAAPATAQAARQFTAPVFVVARYDVISAQ